MSPTLRHRCRSVWQTQSVLVPKCPYPCASRVYFISRRLWCLTTTIKPCLIPTLAWLNSEAECIVFSNAFDKAVINEQSSGPQLQSARLATRCVQCYYQGGCFSAVWNATFCSQFSAHITTEFWVSIRIKQCSRGGCWLICWHTAHSWT